MTRKIIIITGSVLIGLISMLGIIFTMIATGAIEVEQKTIVFSSASAESVYTGDDLTAGGWEIISGELREGHTAKVTVSGKQNAVGTAVNTISATIVDENGADVSDYYKIEYQPGTLRVFHRSIQILANSATKVYDGTPLACNQYTIAAGELPAGHIIVPTYSEGITNVGTVVNSISVVIRDASGKDITSNYNVLTLDGSLTVTKRPIYLQSASDSKVFDGEELTLEEYSVLSGELVAGHTIDPVFTGSITNAGTVLNELSVTIRDADENIVTDNYNVNITNGTLTVVKHTLHFSSESYEKTYNGVAYSSTSINFISGDLLPGHTYTYDILASILNVGSVSNTFTVTILDADENEVTSNYDIVYHPGTLTVKPRAITIVTGSDEKIYDGTPLSNDYWNIEHGTLLSGESIEVSLIKSITEEGSISNDPSITISNADNQDITYNYEITVVPGTLTIKKLNFSIVSPDVTKDYDGEAIPNGEVSIYNLPSGYTVDVTFTSSLTNVGTTDNLFTVIVKNSDNVDVTDNFNIECTYGTLTVKPRAYGIITPSLEKTYDGTPLKNDGTYTVVEGSSLVKDHKVTIEFTGTRTDAGTAQNRFVLRIWDNDGNNVTSNYDLSNSIVGTLTVYAPKIYLYTESDTKMYDGTALTKHGVLFGESKTVISSGDEIIPGFRLYYRMTGTQTDAGSSDNRFTYYIVNASGVDVTDNFDIEISIGTLTVVPYQIVCKSDDIVEFYSDTEIKCTTDNCSMISGELILNHTITFVPLSSSTDVCDTHNNFYVVITNQEGINVTDNYDITYIYGRFTILPRVIKVITPSANHMYDGLPFSCHEYTIDPSDALVEGHKVAYISFSPHSVLTDVGSVKNRISSIRIENGDEKDVTRNYSIDYSEIGDITVTPRPITIRTPDASKDYDGTPLTDTNWEVVSVTKPADNHLLEVGVSGTITEVGRRDNTIAEVKITDKTTNESVVSNYTITIQLGVLTVKGEPANIPDDDDTGETNSAGSLNEGGGLGGNHNAGDDTVCLRLYSTQSGPIYLRMKSFGNFDTYQKAWTEAISYYQLLDGKYSYNYLSSIALHNTGLQSGRVDIENFMSGQYFVPYFPDTYGGDYTVQTSDVSYSGRNTEEYSLYYYLYSGYYTGINADLGEYSDEELLYRKFVKENYLFIDENLRAYMQKIIDDNGLDPSSETVISDVATYIQSAANYNLDYNTAIDTAVHPIIAFLTEKEGVCRHYASAATALYRALGIPARYTVGFTGNTVANEWVEITGKQAHAWTEVYIDGIGWIPVEVTGSSNDGSGSDLGGGDLGGEGSGSNNPENNKAYTVRPKTTYHKYNGNYFVPNNEVDGLSDLLSQGFTYKVTVELAGEATNLPGIHKTKITSFILYDSNGNDVTANYKLNFANGSMQIYLKEITVRTYGGSKVYDGTALTCDQYLIEGTLLSGHRLKSFVCTGAQVNIGKSTNNFTISIVDESGMDVTSHYKINRVCAALTVTPKTITVTANSASKSYDGEALTDTGYTITGDYEGYRVEVTVSGTQTKIGYSDNTIVKVVVKDRYGVNVTMNFSIICVNGRLTVTPPSK